MRRHIVKVLSFLSISIIRLVRVNLERERERREKGQRCGSRPPRPSNPLG